MLGEIGVSFSDLNEMTLGDVFNACLGYAKAQENEFKRQWEQTRAIAASNLMPHLPKGHSRDVQKIWPLPWDEKPSKIITGDPKKLLEESLRKFDNK